MGEHEQVTKVTFASRVLHVFKAVVTVVGGIALFVSQVPDVTPFIPAEWRPYVGGVLILVNGFAVWWVKNRPLVEKLAE